MLDNNKEQNKLEEQIEEKLEESNLSNTNNKQLSPANYTTTIRKQYSNRNFQNNYQRNYGLQDNYPNERQEKFQNNGFRSEYQGTLAGLHSILNILYAGVGFVSFGQSMWNFAIDAMNFFKNCCLNIFDLTSVINFLTRRGNFENIWNQAANDASVNVGSNNKILIKALFCLRLAIVIGNKI